MLESQNHPEWRYYQTMVYQVNVSTNQQSDLVNRAIESPASYKKKGN